MVPICLNLEELVHDFLLWFKGSHCGLTKIE